MARLVRLKDIMSDYYVGVLEYETILEVEQYELDELQAAIDRQAANQFIMTADIDGVAAWESMVGIPTQSGLDIEARRYNVLVKLLPQQPITPKYLSDILEQLNVNASITKDTAFNFKVEFTSTDDGAADRLNLLLKQLMPANLTFNLLNRLTEIQTGTTYIGAGSSKEIERTNIGG